MTSVPRNLMAVMAVGVLLVAALLGWSQWSAARYFDERHARWLRDSLPIYQQMATNVMGQRSALTSEPRDIGHLLSPPFKGSARTNPDGSVTIMFPGGEGGPRHGYIYHSGPLLTKHPGDSKDYIYHLTNEWYEY